MSEELASIFIAKFRESTKEEKEGPRKLDNKYADYNHCSYKLSSIIYIENRLLKHLKLLRL